MTNEPPWVIVGCGRVGRTLALAAERLGIEVRACWSRAHGPITELAEVFPGAAVLLTVSDDAIAEVAAELAPLSDAALVVHCSGSLSSTILREAGIAAPVGSVHPLLAVAEPSEAVDRLSSAAWTIEGHETARAWATRWLGRLGVHPTIIEPRHKILYHAAAVTSAGLLVALMDTAFAMAEAAGINGEDARRMLLPLARSTLANLESMSTADALTGPVARGDEAVLAAHRAALDSLEDANVLEVYRALTTRAVALSNGGGSGREE